MVSPGYIRAGVVESAPVELVSPPLAAMQFASQKLKPVLVIRLGSESSSTTSAKRIFGWWHWPPGC